MEKSLAELQGLITILPSEAAGFSLSPVMPDRKLRGASSGPASVAKRRPKKSVPRRGRSADDVAADSFYRDLVWTLRNGVLAITRDGRIAFAGAAEVADRAAQATADLVPKVGRARPLAEKSLGTPDAGAVSMALAFRAVSESLAGMR